MKKLVMGLMVFAALAFVSYGAYAHCGKCGHDTKCATKSSKQGCRSMADKPACRSMAGNKGCCMDKPCGCCDKCMCAAAKQSGPAGADVQEFAPDPVCGMDVEIKDAKYTSEYKDKTYYFCNESCKDRFDKDPSKFLGE